MNLPAAAKRATERSATPPPRRPGRSSGLNPEARLQRWCLWLAALSLLGGAVLTHAAATGPWEVNRLLLPPTTTWGAHTGLTQEVYYEGEPLNGQPTRIFAYYGRPATESGSFPAMLLAHGGGGRASREWAEHWARRGYAALAMDLSGNGPNGRLPDGGPNQDDETKFRPFTDTEVGEMWTYHAVAAILRGHGLLRARPEVDPRRIGVTGLSWGGYLTCIVAGVDPWVAVAVPVYGCGFLHENSVWRERRFDPMPDEQRQRWVAWFDPSQYLSGARGPILFLNGSNDFAYPLDSYRKSFELVRGNKTLSVVLNLPHGHLWTFPEVDAFVDAAMGRAAPFPRLESRPAPDGQVRARLSDARNPVQAWLHFTTDSGPWQSRRWQTTAARVRGSRVEAQLPSERPLTAFLAVQDARGLRVSAPHIELAAPTTDPGP
jgi:dienelactone hydrolase